MKLWIFIFFNCLNCFCQNFLVSNVDEFVGVDIYENYYYLKSGALHKSSLNNNYINIKYGNPDVVDISNPLQILLFYKYFNKLILLDNRLNLIAEIEIPFGAEFIANASKDKIWIYDEINMRVSLYNFKTQKPEISSIPLTEKIIKLKGNLNQAIAINEKNQLIKFNYIARKTVPIDLNKAILPISMLSPFLIRNNILYSLDKQVLKTPNNIQLFEVMNSKLYFFKQGNIYLLPIPKN